MKEQVNQMSDVINDDQSLLGFLTPTPTKCNISEIVSNSLATWLLKRATVRDEENEGEVGLDPAAARDQGTGSITIIDPKRAGIFPRLQSHTRFKTVCGSKTLDISQIDQKIKYSAGSLLMDL